MFFFFRVITGFVITLLSLHRFLLLLFFSAPAHERKKSENSRRAKRGCLKHPLVGIAEIAVLRQYDMVQKPDVNRLASPFQPACQVVVLQGRSEVRYVYPPTCSSFRYVRRTRHPAACLRRSDTSPSTPRGAACSPHRRS